MKIDLNNVRCFETKVVVKEIKKGGLLTMSKFFFDTFDFDEVPEEFEGEIPEENLEIPDPYLQDDAGWAESVDWSKKDEAGGKKFKSQDNYGLPAKETSTKIREELSSVGLSYDHLGDLSEDLAFIFMDDAQLIGLKEDIRKMIDEKGPDHAQEVADRMLKEERLSDPAHEMISRLVRIHRGFKE